MENYNVDAESVVSKNHKLLVNNILNLNARQNVQRSTRTEPTAYISEYNLVKSLTDTADTIKLHDLTKSLKSRSVHSELRQKVKKTETKSKTLPKPLEKPQAERIKRSVAYENVKNELERWDPVVTSNRVSTNLSFPLRVPNFDHKEGKNFTSNWVLKSNLEKQLEKLDNHTIIFDVRNDETLPTTLEQMIEKRKEMEELRRYKIQKEIKTRWKNKIKSKTFRRIQRKEKLKKQMAEFESLQKTNPEEAMKKLEEIEKSRAEERATLRHKSTGKWARNQQIRAKYNKESRQVLAEQLSISKSLMQKQQSNESSDTEDDGAEESNNLEEINNSEENNDYNRWVTGLNVSNEIKDFVDRYKKFSENANAKDSKLSSSDKKVEPAVVSNFISLDTSENVEENINKTLENDNLHENPPTVQTINKNEKLIKRNEKKLKVKKSKIEKKNRKSKNVNKLRANLEFDSASAAWEVTPVANTSIDDIFDNIEHKIKNKINQKYKKIKLKLDTDTDAKKRKKVRNREHVNQNKSDIKNQSTLKQKKSVSNDETMQSMNIDTSEENVPTNINLLKTVLEADQINNSTNSNSFNGMNTDFSKLFSDDVKAANNGLTEELLVDEDLVGEFIKDKNDEIQKGLPSDVDLTLPGWGTWGGANIKTPRRKSKRFIVKFPKTMPRKDMNVGNLIINETDTDIKSHLVNEIPFPFKTVKDFEASLRAPIGNTFIPETAYRRMIKPTMRTQMGASIEPITKDVLLKKNWKKGKNL